MADLAALVHKSTPPPRRVATAGMADLAAPVTKPTSPQRVAAAGMADLAAPVKKSTWPTRPVATPGAAHPAAPVPHADQAPTSTAVPALPHSILPMSKRKATLMDQQLADLSQLLGATEAKKRMADIIVDRMAASYSAHCDSNEAFVYR
jgi:hypothetical protein